VVCGSDGSLKLWDIRTGAYIRDLVIGLSSVWQVSFHNNLLVAASNRQGNTVFDVFDFGQSSRPVPLDDDNLDKLRRPPWERKDPREPQSYQADDMECDSVSPGLPHSFERSQWLRGEPSLRRPSTSRRSMRLAGKSVGSGIGIGVGVSNSSCYTIEPPPRSKRSAVKTEQGSPSPSRRTGLPLTDRLDERFEPIFDDDVYEYDELMNDEDDVV